MSEDIRVEHYRGFGDRAIYRFEDTDGEVIWFEMNGKSREECREIKDEWLLEKRANKDLHDEVYKQYLEAREMVETLAPGEGVIMRTQGFCFDQYRDEYKYHRDEKLEYYLILKDNKEFDWFTHKVYGSSPADCENKMYKYLRQFKDNNDNIVQKIEKIVEYKK